MGDANQNGLAKYIPKHDADVMIHTGDVVYPDAKASDYPSKFFQPYAEVLRRAACYPVLGNHDWDETLGSTLCDNFVLPANGPDGMTPEQNYWFDIGDVRFVAVNSNVEFEVLRDKVAPWMDTVLREAGDRWKVAFFHHPAYTNSKHSPSGKLQQTLIPLFDRYRVNLALQGHNHLYERSQPIRGGNVVAAGDGTVYVTTGAGGAELYDARKEPSSYIVKQDDKQWSFTVVDVTPQTMSLQQIGSAGQMIDQVEIPRPAPTTAPATASAPATR
jgi:3',5'-cyclic AMP phosphodiesterase CpdA